MNTQTIKSQLRILRLSTAASEMDEVLSKSSSAPDLNWVCNLLQREIDQGRENSLQARIRASRFPEITSLETFDFKFNPKINETKIRELAQLTFVDRKQIVLFLGPPGVGKTHLAIAIGYQCIQLGKKVYCSTVKKLAQDILMHKNRNTLDLFFRRILSCHLWIIDDWAVLAMQKTVAEEIFDLMDRRKNHSAMILTSNRDISEWEQVFPDVILAQATVDRIFDRADTLIFEGESYRLKNRIQLFQEPPK